MGHAGSILLVATLVLTAFVTYFAYVITTRTRATAKSVHDGEETEEVRQQLGKTAIRGKFWRDVSECQTNCRAPTYFLRTVL